MKFFRKEINAVNDTRINHDQPDVYSAMGGMIIGALFGGRGER